MKFRAAVLTEPSQPLVLEELQVPKLSAGQILVKLDRAVLCECVLDEAAGVRAAGAPRPRLLGHEGTGWVHDRGKGVTAIPEGARVALHRLPGRGLEAEPARFRSRRLGTVDAGLVSSCGEYAVVSENRATPIPPELDPEVGALLGCALTAGLGVIDEEARIRFGASVVVWGSGGTGLSVIQGAALASAGDIVAVDSCEPTLALARRLGATRTVNSRRDKVVPAVLAVVGPAGADLVVDNTGDSDALQRCRELTRRGGKTLLLRGAPRKSGARPDRDIPRLLALHRMGKLPLAELVTARYRLDRVNEALDDLRGGRIAGRCAILFQ